MPAQGGTDSQMQGDPAVAVTLTVTGLPIVTTAVGGPYTITYSYDDGCNPVAQEVRTVEVVDTTLPVITANGGSLNFYHENGQPYTPPAYSATDSCDGSLTAGVVVSGDTVDPNTDGDYDLYYDVDDGEGNSAVQQHVIVHVVSNAPPVITIPGDNPLTLECNVDAWVEPSVTADDAEDGDITGDIVANWLGSAVDTSVPATYQRQYYVEDSEGASDTDVLEIYVVDTTDPVITLDPVAGPTIGRCGTYTLPTATATDTCDGDLTASVTYDDSGVDVNTVGNYNVVYEVVDAEGNTATENWPVSVVTNPVPTVIINGSASLQVQCGATYTDAGCTATDSQIQGDPAVTVTPTITGLPINMTHTGGPYTITYRYDDGCNPPVQDTADRRGD